MKLFTNDGFGLENYDLAEKERAICKMMRYNWNDEVLMFQGLMVPKPKKKEKIVNDIHAKIGHFNEQKTLAEVKRRYFWHDRTKSEKLVQECKQCQLVKKFGSIQFGIEKLKNISFCDLFY